MDPINRPCFFCGEHGIDTPTDLTLWVRAYHNTGSTCDCCGGDVQQLPVCAECQDASGLPDDACPDCWNPRGRDLLLANATFDRVEADGRDAAQSYLNELTDEEGRAREADADDLTGLGDWSEGAVNNSDTWQRLEAVGLPCDGSDAGQEWAWRIIKSLWCRSYNAGAKEVIDDAKKELEGGA